MTNLRFDTFCNQVTLSQFYTDTSRETEVLWVRDKEVPLHSKRNSKSYIVALDGQASTPMKCDGEGQVIPTYTASGDVL